MAQIVFTPIGSSGDVHPFLSVAQVLRARGHTVRFVVEADHVARVQGAGFEVVPLPGDGAATLGPYAREIFGVDGRSQMIELLLQKHLLPLLPEWIATVQAACKDADLLVNSILQFAASIVAEQQRIPWASIVLSPMNVPAASVEAWPAWIPAPLRRTINRGVWAALMRYMRRLADAPINAARAQAGLRPRHDFLFYGNLSPQRTVVTVSPAFLPPAPEWPHGVKMTGFCFYDGAEEWQLPADLEAFLATDQPVVAVSSGSMAPGLAPMLLPFYQTSIHAARAAGARTLLIGVTPEQLAMPVPEDVCAVAYAPFSVIYPRSTAVVHHGGIGTVAQAMRAGVPMLVAPWGGDQFFNGARVKQLGIGQWLKRTDYTEAKVQAILTDLLTVPSYRATAQRLATQVQREDGAEHTADTLETLLSSARGGA